MTMASAFIFPDPPWPANGTNYGRDLSCFLRSVTLPIPDGTTRTSTIFDLAANMGEVDGRQCLAEALARRLVTTRGTLIDDPNYGFDLRVYVNDDIDTRGLALIASGVEAEMLKDERVVQAKVTATLTAGVLLVVISVIDSSGPFKLTLTVDGVSVGVLTVGV